MAKRKNTTLDRILNSLKNNKFIALALVIGIVVIAISEFTDALNKIGSFVGIISARDTIDLNQHLSSNPITFKSVEFMTLIESKDLIPQADTSPHQDSITSTQKNAKLLFVLENVANYLNTFGVGLSISFCLNNQHTRPIVVHSLQLETIKYWDESTKEFRAISRVLPSLLLYASAPISVYGFRAILDPKSQQCNVSWTQWDDSGESRGVTFYASKTNNYSKMISLIEKSAGLKADTIDTALENFELLPSSFRFLQKPQEIDCFHGQVLGTEDGIYQFRFQIKYHSDGEIHEIKSDQTFTFVSCKGLLRKLRR